MLYLAAGMLASFADKVTRIIDHHQKEGSSLADKDGVSTVLEKTGSCTSLIACEILKDKSFIMEEPIAKALLTVILLDTGNLTHKGRVTSTDSSVAHDLINFLPSSFNSEEHFSRYFSARFNVPKESKQVLEMDYKESRFSNRYVVGFSSMTMLLSEFLSRAEAKECVADFYSAHNPSAFIMFGVSIAHSNPTEMHKQIAVYQPEGGPSEFTESLVMMFEMNEELSCKRLEGVEEFQGVVFDQGNVELSRKSIIPILEAFISLV